MKKHIAIKLLCSITLFGAFVIYKNEKATNFIKRKQLNTSLHDTEKRQGENDPIDNSISIQDGKQPDPRPILLLNLTTGKRQGEGQLGSYDVADVQRDIEKNVSVQAMSQYTDMSDSDIENRQKNRQTVLNNACTRLNMSTSNKTDVMGLLENVKLLYSEKHKFIVCEIPKCGCSTIKKILLVTEGFVNETDPKKIDPSIVHSLGDAKLNLKTLRDVKEISHRMDSYYKLIIVRDPMYRLLSAYRNKLEREYPWSKHFADISRKIHAKYAENSDSKLASFSEFVSYVAETNDQFDQHWEMFHKLCNPCQISYDFVAHVETIDDDMRYVMEKVKMSNLSLPQNYDKSKTTNQEKFAKYFDVVPKNIVQKVYKKYHTDYDLFGYAEPLLRTDE